MLSPETLKADFDKASSVWGGGPTVDGSKIPGFIEDRTELVETEEGVVERHYKVLITTTVIAAKTRINAGAIAYTTAGAPARDGVFDYRLREVK